MNYSRKLTDLGVEVKKQLIDKNMSQREFCRKYGIPENRFSEILYGVRPGKKYKKIIKKALDLD
ncbi:Rha family transcriptional regulator [Clostridiisalibacter paucivorans]|uniref:Rha family transcriptional regulator n=1 Tax=Clostridiisalibacter paucivorans TaxID=408753 RepID=UPI0004793F80|nr:Rha family transcriptional regulator [Clostridiisalibacter paucivorans]